MNWTEIISEIIAADSGSINQVKSQQNTVNQQATAMGTISTQLTAVENDVFDLETPSVYGQVSGTSDTTGSTWGINATSGTAPGNYTLAVSQLATPTEVLGGTSIAGSISSTSDVSGVTLATLPAATAVTAGNITVDGQQIAVTTSESLQDVFNAIQTATGVVGSYDPTADKVTLTSGNSSPAVLGAANDSSNLLSVLGLENSNTGSGTSVTSQAKLGTLQPGNVLSGGNFATPLSGQDASGNGSFSINGVSISYNTGTDTLQSVINKIDAANAGVTAQYDATDDIMVLTNNSTGNQAINFADTQGNLLDAMGLNSTSTQNYGLDAKFSINGGPTQISSSNALTPTQLGIAGLNVTPTTTGTQVISVTTNINEMSTDIQQFMTDFNTLENTITDDTQISVSNGSIATSLLSSQHEVGDWGSQLEMSVFGAGSQNTGAIKSLSDMGIDFNGTSSDLEITDTAALQQQLSANPSAVQAFFTTGGTGFGSIVNNLINDIQSQVKSEQGDLQSQSTDLGNQIDTMQNDLDAQQTQLENEFEAMEAAEAKMQTENQALANISGSTASSVLSNAPTVSIPNSSSSNSSSSSSDSSTNSSSSDSSS
jgi:flagellar hook-associated protein 2